MFILEDPTGRGKYFIVRGRSDNGGYRLSSKSCVSIPAEQFPWKNGIYVAPCQGGIEGNRLDGKFIGDLLRVKDLGQEVVFYLDNFPIEYSRDDAKKVAARLDALLNGIVKA